MGREYRQVQPSSQGELRAGSSLDFQGQGLFSGWPRALWCAWKLNEPHLESADQENLPSVPLLVTLPPVTCTVGCKISSQGPPSPHSGSELPSG